MYGVTLNEFNFALVFGAVFGMYIVTNIEVIARNGVNFVRGWRA